MSVKKNLQKNKILIYIILSYVIVLFIPLIIGKMASDKTLDMAKSNTLNSNMNQLINMKEIMDVRIKEIDNIVTTLSWDEKLGEMQPVTTPFIGDTPYKIGKLRDSLPNYSYINNFIHSYYILFENSQMVISPGLAYKMNDFYKNYLNYDHLELEQWYTEFFETYHFKKYIPATYVNLTIGSRTSRHSVITYLNSINYSVGNNVTIMILINNDEVQKLLGGIKIENKGLVYIENNEGDIISIVPHNNEIHISNTDLDFDVGSGMKIEKIDNDEMLISYTTSSYNGWRYIAVQPLKDIMKDVDNIRNILWISIVISLFAGTFLAFLISRNSASKIIKTINDIKEYFTGKNITKKNDFEFLSAGVSKIIEDSQVLKKSIETQKPFLKAAFIDRLIKGEINNIEYINSFSRNLGIQLDGILYTIIIFRFVNNNSTDDDNTINENEIKRIIINDVIENILKQESNTCFLEEDKFVLLLSSNESDKNAFIEKTYEMCKDIMYELESKYDVDVVIAIGGICDKISGVSILFEQAKQTLAYQTIFNNPSIMTFNDIPKDNKSYYYTNDVELRLVNNIRSGNKNDTEALFKMIFAENFTNSDLSSKMLGYLLYDLRGTILKIIGNLIIDDPITYEGILNMIDRIDLDNDIVKAFTDLQHICINLCDIVNKQKRSNSSIIKNKIIDYVNETYLDCNLSLSSIADKLNISEVYVSLIFKDQTGENLYSYIENLRMSKACELLKNSDYSIKDIAEKSGYNNVISFGRAFKRKLGVTPSSFRAAGK